MYARTLTIALFALAVCITGVHAATREWSVDAPGQIYQVVGDGKGGCAFVWITTAGVPTVVWVDKKGAVKYEKTLSPTSWPFSVAQCTRRQINYLSDTGSGHQLVQIDKQGRETSVATSGQVVANGGYPFTLLNATDKKGFFVVQLSTNTPAPTSQLVRYSNK